MCVCVCVCVSVYLLLAVLGGAVEVTVHARRPRLRVTTITTPSPTRGKKLHESKETDVDTLHSVGYLIPSMYLHTIQHAAHLVSVSLMLAVVEALHAQTTCRVRLALPAAMVNTCTLINPHHAIVGCV